MVADADAAGRTPTNRGDLGERAAARRFRLWLLHVGLRRRRRGHLHRAGDHHPGRPRVGSAGLPDRRDRLRAGRALLRGSGLRGLGDFAGLVAGSALVLDYTIDITLFTVVAFGYINYFLPWISLGHHITDFTLTLGPIHLAWLWLIESVIGIVVLIWLNVRGI